ncbi:MAG: hypothetical protein NVS9B15_12990 [Acidobacteriaceae bacterium]
MVDSFRLGMIAGFELYHLAYPLERVNADNRTLRFETARAGPMLIVQ